MSIWRVTGTRKSLFLTFVTAHGLAAGDYVTELVANEVRAAALTLRRISASILVLSLLFVVRIFGNDFAIFPYVNRRAVHARNLPSGPCSPPQTATHTRGKAFCPLRYFTSSGHGSRSSNMGFDLEFSYMAQ